MGIVQFIQNTEGNQQNNRLVNDCFKLRNKVFKERLNWKVNSCGGIEIDRFDTKQTWYAVLTNDEDLVIGTWRALPTSGDYMLRSVFPQMARGEFMPNDTNVWEISRFAIDKRKRTKPIGSNKICIESKALVKSFYHFSQQQRINQLVAVTSVAAERMMKDLNVNLRRLGDGKAVRIGKVLTTAVLIDIPRKQNICEYRQDIKSTNGADNHPNTIHHSKNEYRYL